MSLKPVPFPLDEDGERYLFADAFIVEDPQHGRQLVLVSTYYLDMPFDFSEVTVLLDGQTLNLFDDVGRDEHEPERAVIYPLHYVPERPSHQLEVRYQRRSITAKLVPQRPSGRPVVALATLFKDDWEQVETCYQYYKRQGFDRFYLFYNGLTSRLKEPLYAAPEIIYGEWDFKYWLRGTGDATRHHAQTLFLTMARYKLLPQCQFLALVDLDEFLAVPSQPGVTVREYIESRDEECLSARMYWAEVRPPHNAELRDYKTRMTDKRHMMTSRMKTILPPPRITIEDLAHTYVNRQHEGDQRMKTIYRGDYQGLCGVHKPKRPASSEISDELGLYHLVNSGHGRYHLMAPDATPIALV